MTLSFIPPLTHQFLETEGATCRFAFSFICRRCHSGIVSTIVGFVHVDTHHSAGEHCPVTSVPRWSFLKASHCWELHFIGKEHTVVFIRRATKGQVYMSIYMKFTKLLIPGVLCKKITYNQGFCCHFLLSGIDCSVESLTDCMFTLVWMTLIHEEVCSESVQILNFKGLLLFFQAINNAIPLPQTHPDFEHVEHF